MKTPFDDMVTTPFWWEAAAPEHGLDPDALTDTDILIIGSGYTGLSAAITLAENKAGSITVVDKLRLGEGASTRSGGQLWGAAKMSDAEICRKFGPEVGKLIVEDFRSSLPFFLERAKSLDLNFHLQMTGLFIGSHVRKHYNESKRKWEKLSEAERSRQWPVPEDKLHTEIRTDLYRGGHVYLDNGLVHPALYHKALRLRAEALGIKMYSGIDVKKLERLNGAFVAHFGNGKSIRAGKVITGPNGYADNLTPWLKNRVVPVRSYQIATEEMDESLLHSLIPNGRAIADTKNVLYYYRKSPDGKRILFGGRASIKSNIDENRASVGLYRFMTSVFPSLNGCAVTHCWSGNVAFTFDHVPHLGCHDGLYYAAGCNGNGVVMMTFLGDRIAKMILGKGASVSGFDQNRFPTMPGYTGKPWFLPIFSTMYRVRDTMARLQDRWQR